jgi:predicted alpha/beta-fold hydrolase
MSDSIDPRFRPPPWLRSAHVQSILQALALRGRRVRRRARPLLAASAPLIVDAGAGVRLLGFRSRPATSEVGGRVVVLHGWEGSSDSLHVLSLAQELFARGHEVIRLNFRDHGPTHHLNPELFHSCRLPEIVGAVRTLLRDAPRSRLALAGFSLGGNFALRVAADARREGLALARVFAVSPVLDPAATLDAMEQTASFYERYFIRSWRQSLRTKQAAWPGRFDFAPIGRLGSLRRMTAALVQGHTEYATLGSYLEGYSIVGARLAELEVPSLLLTALDDPIIPARDLSRLARTEALRVVLTRHGGHCGFLESLSGPSFADRLGVEALLES